MPFLRRMNVPDGRGQKLRCSFCRKDEGDVARLISGPGVYICSECVHLCNRILEDETVRSP